MYVYGMYVAHACHTHTCISYMPYTYMHVCIFHCMCIYVFSTICVCTLHSPSLAALFVFQIFEFFLKKSFSSEAVGRQLPYAQIIELEVAGSFRKNG